MILQLKYQKVRFACGTIRWKCLVKCDECGCERVVQLNNVKRGVGATLCQRCAKLGPRNHLYGKTISQEQRKRISDANRGENHYFFGKHLSVEHRKHISEGNMGSKNGMFGKYGEQNPFFGKHHSQESIARQKSQMIGRFVGSKSPRWNPKLTDEDRRNNRAESVYKLNTFRKLVYTRDDFICQITGDNQGGNLNVHHLYNWANYPDKRYDINNGITLRKDIHKLFHQIYGSKNNTPEQFFEFCLYIHEVLNT